MRHVISLTVLASILLASADDARADRIKAARELAELAIKKFGREAADEGAERLTGRIAAAAARYGDDAAHAAIRRLGPRAITLADEAGEHGPLAMRLMGKYGDEAATFIVREPRALALAAKHGDEAASVLVRHKGIALPLIERHGDAAVHALTPLGPRNARRLAMLSESGELARLGRTEALLGALREHGDACMQFIWEHKATLAVGSTLATFLADPAPYITGARELAETAIEESAGVAGHVIDGAAKVAGSLAEHAAAPVAEALSPALQDAARTSGRLIALVGAALALATTGPLVIRRCRRLFRAALKPARA